MESITVLIIDDEESVRHSLAEYLLDFDYKVSVADTAERALMLLRNKRFDVAIVDLRLPGINGEAFILRAQDVAPTMKILVHTGSVDYRLSGELLKLGIQPKHLIAKPQPDLHYFIEVIQELLTPTN